MVTSRALGGITMSERSTFRLTFHVYHPTISAAEIEGIFGMPTRFSQSVGHPQKTKSGRKLDGIYSCTNISFSIHEHPLSTDSISICNLIKAQLKSYNRDYIHEIVRTGGSCNFLLGLFTSESMMFEIDREAIDLLSLHQVTIKFDFYGGSD